MSYSFKYRMQQAPQATSDGTGCVLHDIYAIYRDEGADPGDPWLVVPGYHKSVVVTSDDLKIVLDMANGAAKVAAYKNLLASNVNTQLPAVVADWTLPGLEARMAVNDAATLEATRADEYITVTLGQSYPVDFSL